MYLLLPLLAAIAFALGSMVFKRAFQEGAGLGHAVVMNNITLGILFLPLLALAPGPIPWHLWHHPVLTSVTFVIGHLLNIVALRVGEVSVATPLLGSKVVFIGLISWWAFGVPLTPTQWWSAGLATAGVLVMGVTDFRAGRGTGVATLLSLGCAICFAITDLLIQQWGEPFGVYNFLPLQFVSLAILSSLLLPVLGLKSLRAPRPAWRWIGMATGFSAMQAILITASIAIWRDAAGVNVVYATRGLWSVLLVWGIGHWMGNRERHHAGRATMFFRLVGAALILGAVVLTGRHAGAAPASPSMPVPASSPAGGR